MKGPTTILFFCLFLSLSCSTTLASEIWPNSTQINEVDSDASLSLVEEDVPTPTPSLILGPISKSPQDHRAYRAILLSNGIKVILVSDPNTTRAAACLAISVGSTDDPPHLQGLAHFLEHMLFLGNVKYPTENYFQNYISSHGGASNAITQPDRTSYFFRVSPSALIESLDRFAALFISPLFSPSALSREVLAVDSEHLKYIPDDRRRLERAEASTGRSGHPFTQYRTGTRDTLLTTPTADGVNVSDALASFHLEHYSADRMSLAVLGKEPLDTLQSLVESIFLSIPTRVADNHTHTNGTDPGPLYSDEELGERLDIAPAGNVRWLQLLFPVPTVTCYYKNTALGYISHLMGQEGGGSLASYLKGLHWAESVTVGAYLPAQTMTFFKVKISLTLTGLQNIDPIIKLVFQYIGMMRESGPQSWFWEELRDLNLLHFRFRDEAYPMDLVQRLSVSAMSYPTEKVLHAAGIDPDLTFDPAGINQTLTFLTPTNSRVFVVSPEFENTTSLRESYLGVEYNRRKLDPALLQDWSVAGSNPVFHMPSKNEFIPSQFDLKPRHNLSLGDGVLTPRKLLDGALSQLWFLQDNVFLLPKASVSVELLTPVAYEDPSRSGCLLLWSSLITESLGEFQYSASLAGLASEVSAMEGGLMITVGGYDHKLGVFAKKILLRILSLSRDGPDPGAFLTVKDSLRQILLNSAQRQPYELGNTLLREILLQRRWSPQEILEALEDITLPKLREFIAEFLSRLKFQWLFYGNLSPEECLSLVSEVESLFTSSGTRALFPSQRPWSPLRVVELPPGANFLFRVTTPSHASSCAVVLFQIGLDSTKNSLLASLLSRVLHPLVFGQLRTQEGLGYVVWGEVYQDKWGASVSFRVVVQGSQNPGFVEGRITRFLAEFETVLGNMTESEFGRHRQSLHNLKSTPPKTMGDRMTALLKEIGSGRGHFGRQAADLQALEGITLADLKEFYGDKVMNPATRRRIVLHIQPTNSTSSTLENASNATNSDPSSPVEVVEDITTWKETMSLYPSLNPFHN